MLLARIKPRAVREIHRAAQWWLENRPAAPGAVEADLKDALALLVEHPGIGGKVENSRDAETRRFYLDRTRYFVYYRPRGQFLEVVAFWHSSREHSRRSERMTPNPSSHPTCYSGLPPLPPASELQHWAQ